MHAPPTTAKYFFEYTWELGEKTKLVVEFQKAYIGQTPSVSNATLTFVTNAECSTPNGRI